DHRLFSAPGRTDGADYFVVRLWEDLIELLPDLVDEVPAQLAARLENADAWLRWTERAWELDDLDLVDAATSWWNERELYSGHFVAAPRLHVWRTGGIAHAHSDHGHTTIALTTFVDEILRFDRALIAAMGARIDEVATSWSRPDIAIDVEDV